MHIEYTMQPNAKTFRRKIKKSPGRPWFAGSFSRWLIIVNTRQPLADAWFPLYTTFFPISTSSRFLPCNYRSPLTGFRIKSFRGTKHGYYDGLRFHESIAPIEAPTIIRAVSSSENRAHQLCCIPEQFITSLANYVYHCERKVFLMRWVKQVHHTQYALQLCDKSYNFLISLNNA